jgi:hypothetical protein
MSITNDNSKRSITSIHNPTNEQITSFFGFDVKDRYDNYERVICISTAINKGVGMINHSIVTTRNRVSCLKENKRISWNVESGI